MAGDSTRNRTSLAPLRFVQDTLQALGTDIWTLRFMGLRSARVVVESPAPHELSCRVLDSSNQQALASQTEGGACTLAWTPARTGAYRIEIRNPTRFRVPYVLKSKQ
jgi:hypothetical protein